MSLRLSNTEAVKRRPKSYALDVIIWSVCQDEGTATAMDSTTVSYNKHGKHVKALRLRKVPFGPSTYVTIT